MAGLTAAIALDRHGIDSLVVDQFDDVSKSQLGAGLSLGVNAARAFKHLGLFDELAQVGAPITDRQFVTEKGKNLGISPISPEGEHVLGVLRPRFHQFLVDAVGDDKLQMGSKLVRFEQDDGGVTAHFADGRTARGDVLIGADGVKSTVRAQLLGETELRYAGYVTRRGVLETESAKDGVERIILGHGQRFLYYPVGRWWMYWTAATNEPPGGKEKGADIRRTVLERFQGWPEPVEDFVQATDDSNLFLADTYDREPVERWGEGRVTLSGGRSSPDDLGQGPGSRSGNRGRGTPGEELARVTTPRPRSELGKPRGYPGRRSWSMTRAGSAG